MSQIALYIVIYKFIYNYIEAEKAVFIFLNDLMTNDLNDYLSVFSQRVNDVEKEERSLSRCSKLIAYMNLIKKVMLSNASTPSFGPYAQLSSVV